MAWVLPDAFVYGGDEEIVVDTTIHHPLVHVTSGAAERTLYAASKGEEEKQAIYGELCEANRYELLPAAFEAYGAIGSRLSQHMKQLAGEAVAREAEVRSHCI